MANLDQNERRKLAQVRAMSSDAMERIISHVVQPRERSAEFPLSGVVHISGIGQVPLTWLQTELAERRKDAVS
jgi:hypothetical protein